MKRFTLIIMSYLFLLNLNAQEKVYSPSPIAPANGSLNLMVNTLVNWSPVSGALKYEVQFDTDPSFSNPIINFTQLSAIYGSYLKYGSVYNWRVRAIGWQADTSAWSSIWTFGIIDKPSVISPINGYSMVSIYPRFYWSRIGGSSGYVLQIDTVNSFNSPYLKNIKTTNTDTTLLLNIGFYGKDYFYRVKAYHPIDTSAWSNINAFKSREYPLLMLPLDGAVNANPAEALMFKGIKGSISYQYEYSQFSNFQGSTLINIPITAESIINPGTVNQDTVVNFRADTLKYGTTYYWRARALSNVDTSIWTPHFQLNIVASVSNLSEPAFGSTGVPVLPTFTWNSIEGSRYYELVFSEDSLFGTYVSTIVNHPAENTSTISYKILYPALKFQTKYYWKVRAYNYRYTADFSDVSHFTTTTPANISNNSSVNSLKIFPNPAIKYFDININSNKSTVLKIVISNILGQEVKSELFNINNGNNEYRINIETLRAGIYFINFELENEKITRKLVVE